MSSDSACKRQIWPSSNPRYLKSESEIIVSPQIQNIHLPIPYHTCQAAPENPCKPLVFSQGIHFSKGIHSWCTPWAADGLACWWGAFRYAQVAITVHFLTLEHFP